MIRLGLIGDNIRRSKSPLLHQLAGRLCGLDVTYEPLIPADMGVDFDTVFQRCRAEGFRGINITYPYKETVFPRLKVENARVKSIGACNTVIFGPGEPRGYNTDYTGFVSAFRENLPGAQPGIVAMVGAGGVGRAVAFALAELGAVELRLVDADRARAETLAASLRAFAGAMEILVAETTAEAAAGCDGLVNCTPLGMVGIPGTAVPKLLMTGCRWAFDAVYTPVDTRFLTDARATGLATISGYELFFHQGIDAFRIFTGHTVDMQALRTALLSGEVYETA